MDRIKIKKLLLSLLLLFLPFAQVLTVDIGFPFKISELALLLLLGFIFASGRFNINKQFEIYFLLFFILIACTSVLVNNIYFFPYSLTKTETRFGYFFDGVTKLIYIGLAFMVYYLISDRDSSTKRSFISFYLIGGVIACVYSWHLFVNSTLGWPYISLPGLGDSPQTVSYFPTIRSGTFKEGNYMALFILTCMGLSSYLNQKKKFIFFALSLITTVSTVGILLGLVLVFFHFFKIHSLRYIPIKYFIVFFFFLVVFGYLVSTPVFNYFVLEKIKGGTEIESTNDWSRVERMNQSIVGVRMGGANPIFGVGASNYSRHYNHFNKDSRFDYGTMKRIPNNVFVEVFSEYGIISLLTFLGFLVFVYKRTKSRILRITFILVLIALNAFPTFTVFFLWAFMGLIVTPDSVHAKTLEK